MERLLRMGGGGGMGGLGGGMPTDSPVVDTAEQVYISSLALLKMLKHGRAGKKTDRNEPLLLPKESRSKAISLFFISLVEVDRGISPNFGRL